MVIRYASDSEVWLLSDDVLQLESCQVLCSEQLIAFIPFHHQEELMANDVMDVMITLQTAQRIFQNILQNPSRDDYRIVHMESWCKPQTSAFKLFKCIGFLTMDDKLFLSSEE